MHSIVWLILSCALSAAYGSFHEKEPQTFFQNNSQQQTQQEHKEVITYPTASQIQDHHLRFGSLEPHAIHQLRSEEDQKAQFLKNSQIRTWNNNQQIQAELPGYETSPQYRAQVTYENKNAQFERFENDQAIHQLASDSNSQGQQEQRHLLENFEYGHLLKPFDARHFISNLQNPLRQPEVSQRQNVQQSRETLFHFDSRLQAGEDKLARPWEPTADQPFANQNINLARLESDQIIIQGQYRLPNQALQENINIYNGKLYKPQPGKEIVFHTQKNIQHGHLEAGTRLNSQVQPEASHQGVSNNQYRAGVVGTFQTKSGVNGSIDRPQNQLRDIEADQKFSQQQLNQLSKDNFLPLENAQSLYNSDILNQFQVEQLLPPPQTQQATLLNNKPKEEDRTTYSLLSEQGQILQKAHDTLKNLHQRLLQSQQDTPQEKNRFLNDSDYNRKEEQQQNAIPNQLVIQSYSENNNTYSYFNPSQPSENSEEIQVFRLNPVNGNEQDKNNYGIQTDPLLIQKLNLIPRDNFNREPKWGQENDPIQVKNIDHVPSLIDNAKGFDNKKHNLPKELPSVQYAPQYNLDKFKAGVIESEKRNFIERQKAIAKAEEIANSPPIVIHEEVRFTPRRPIHVTNVQKTHVEIPVPEPYFIPVSESVNNKAPQPYSVPYDIMNQGPVPWKAEKQEVERPIQAIKKVFVPVDKLYTGNRFAPSEKERELAIQNPQAVTLYNHAWK